MRQWLVPTTAPQVRQCRLVWFSLIGMVPPWVEIGVFHPHGDFEEDHPLGLSHGLSAQAKNLGDLRVRAHGLEVGSKQQRDFFPPRHLEAALFKGPAGLMLLRVSAF